MIVHKPGCTLDAVHWLRHAVAALGYLAHDNPDRDTDRVSAGALTDTLAHFSELPNWESVTLRDVADHATLMTTPLNQDRFRALCTCGALDDIPDGRA